MGPWTGNQDQIDRIQEYLKRPTISLLEDDENVCMATQLTPADAGESFGPRLAAVEEALKKSVQNQEEEEKEQPEHQFDDSKDGRMCQGLEKALQKGGIDIKSPEGQRFSRSLKGEEKEKYTKLNYEEKGKFRLAWAKANFDNLSVKFRKFESWALEDTEVGEYLPLSVIVEREGGWCLAENVRAALCYTQKCCEMKGKWAIFNEMTQRAEFLYVRRQHRETFVRKWQMFTEGSKRKSEGDGENSNKKAKTAVKSDNTEGEKGDDGTEDPVDEKDKDKKNQQKKGGKKDPPKKKDKAEAEDKQGENQHGKKLMIQCQKLKMEFSNISSSAAVMETSIKAGGQWKWAQGTDFVETMLKAKTDLEQAIQDPFIAFFLTNNCEAVKKATKEEDLRKGLLTWLNCEAKIKTLKNEFERLTRMHKACKLD